MKKTVHLVTENNLIYLPLPPFPQNRLKPKNGYGNIQ